MGHVKVDTFFQRNNADTGWTFYCGHGDFLDNDRIHLRRHPSQRMLREMMLLEDDLLTLIITGRHSYNMNETTDQRVARLKKMDQASKGNK